MSLSDYNIIKELGSGASSVVYLAEHKKIGRLVALKRVARTDSNQLWLNREITCQSQCDHPNIIELFEVIETTDSVYLATEYARNGNLASYLQRNGPMKEEIARKVFCELADAMFYLHNTLRIIHRDVKPDNVMLDDHSVPKLADFGYSKPNSKNEVAVQTACGSPVYVAPEVCKREPYSYPADIWSLGILLFFMVSGKFPFVDSNIVSLMRKICEDPLELPQGLSDDLVSLLQKMLTKNPDERITSKQLMDDPWVRHGSPRNKARWYSEGPSERALEKMEKIGYARSHVLDEMKEDRFLPEAVLFRILRNSERMQNDKTELFPMQKPRTHTLADLLRLRISPIPVGKPRCRGLTSRYSERAACRPNIVVPLCARRASLG